MPHSAAHSYMSPYAGSIARWLLMCAASVICMVVLGGLTRLTHSGLSIVEWDVFAGIIPPLQLHDWLTLFEKYQATPEYLLVNPGMSLGEFQQIFWLEYVHRLLGRLVGLLFLCPFLYFTFKRAFTPPLFLKLLGIFLLGGLQGLAGWYMVKSGLHDQPEVDHYRLALHLLLACAILLLLIHTSLSYLRAAQRAAGRLPDHFHEHPAESHYGGFGDRFLLGFTAFCIFLLFLQLTTGAFVAGLHAGLIYNSYPLMEGKFLPESLWWLSPWYRNLGENVATVQFLHRNFALVFAGLILLLGVQLHKRGSGFSSHSAPWHRHLAVMGSLLITVISLQFILGVATLIWQAPLFLASLHQCGAILLLILLGYIHHYLAMLTPYTPRTKGKRAVLVATKKAQSAYVL